MKRVTFIVAGLALVLLAAPGTAKENAKSASLGKAAPAFELNNQSNEAVDLSAHKGKIVVLEWTNPDCPFVQRHYRANTMETLAKKYSEEDVVWLAVNSTNYATVETNAKFASAEGLTYPVLDDHEGRVGHEYAATNTPHMYVIGKDGKLLYRGAIDDDPRGNKAEPTNYVAKALDEVLAGKAVSMPETKAYGCSVKYKK